MKLSSIPNTRASKYLILSAAITLFCSLPVVAQQEDPQQKDLTPPKAEIKLMVGAGSFTSDDGRIAHGAAGAAVRIYVSHRVSIEPEFLYLRNSPDDRDYLFQPSVAYDLTEPTGRVVAYVIGGVGVLHHSGRFFGVDFVTRQPRVFDTSFNSIATSAGVGVKIS